MTAPIIERIRETQDLPSLSIVAMEILQLCQDDNVPLAHLAEVLQQDGALTAKILKTVNSPFFGVPREISSPQQAIAMLGVRTVKQLSLSFSLADTVERIDAPEFDYQAYWRRSLTNASSARLMAVALNPRLVDEAMAGGLLSDLGMVAAWRCASDLYTPVLERAAICQQPLQEIELEQLGVTHADITRELLAGWNLPGVLCDIVATHHGQGLEQLPNASRECATIVHCGTIISELFCGDVAPDELDAVKKKCQAISGVTAPMLEGILDELTKHVHASAIMMAVEVGELLDYTKLQQDAKAKLLQLSAEPA